MATRSSTGLLLVFFVGLGSSAAHARPLYPEPVKWITGDSLGFAVGDFNNDGHLDLVQPDRDFHKVRVHLGNGDGSFTTLPDQFSDDCPIDAAAADFDGDGDLDLALGKYGGCTTGTGYGISVLMGNGDGTFASETDYDNGVQMFSVVVADFNDDDVPDLLGVGTGGLVLLGNGDGTFAMFSVPGNGYHAGVGDLDGDGLDDYVYAQGTVRVQLSNGDGTFDLAGTSSVGDEPGAVVVADVSQDSVNDLVVTNETSNDISVLLGNGDGSFAAEQRYPVTLGAPGNVKPWHASVDDLDGDGLPDLVVANWWGGQAAPAVVLLYGTGGGLFAPAVAGDARWGFIHEVVTEDFDGDGALDLVRSCMNCSGIKWLFGDGRGAFIANLLQTVGEQAIAIVAADFDADGRVDLVTANEDSDDLSVLLADGAGSFAPEQRFCVVAAAPPCPAGNDPSALAFGELTGDDHADLAVTNAGSDSISVLAGDGAGGFSFVTSLAVSAGAAPSSIAMGDLDGNDEQDLAVVGEGAPTLFVFLGNGDGTFDPLPAVPLGLFLAPTAVVLDRFDADMLLDAAVSSGGANNVTILLGDGDGTFTQAPSLSVGSGPNDLTAGDVDGDQVADLVVVHDWPTDLYVFSGNGDGSFAAPTVLGPYDQTPIGGESVRIADLDGDGASDIVTNGVLFGNQTVLTGHADGTFGPPRNFASAGGHFTVGDFNLDSRLDLAAVGSFGNSHLAAILLNQAGPRALRFAADGVTLVWPAEIGALSYDLYRGDLPDLVDIDDDGLPDSGYGVCLTGLDSEPRDTFFEDAELPLSPGSGFFYLMSVIGPTGDLGPGTTSAGLPRVPEIACP